MAHSCSPKQPNRAGRSAVRTSSSRTKRSVSPRALLKASTSTLTTSPSTA